MENLNKKDEHDLELIRIAVLFDMAPDEIKIQAWSILSMYGACSLPPLELGHKQEQTVLPLLTE